MPKINKIEITTLADIPSGTGLGSSGSFTAALILAIFAHKGHFIDKQELAELACEIEIEKLKQPIGKQDQFVTSFGGINSYHFYKNDKVKVEPLNISNETIYELEDNLLLFFTGYSRQAVKILKDQDTKTKLSDKEIVNLDFIKDQIIQSKDYLEKGDLKFWRIVHEHWLYKKNRTQNISNFKINELYNLGYKNGVGGKLVGAGGGGFDVLPKINLN